MTDRPRSPRLNQVTLATTDVPRATAFYRALGLVPIVESSHYVRFVVPGNEATLSVHVTDRVSDPSTVVYLECDDLDATVADLARSGIVFDEPPTDRRWRWREARLRDPDGNPLCLYHAGDDRLNPPWRVEGSKVRHRLTPERFRRWLDRLAADGRAPAAGEDLFAPGADPVERAVLELDDGGRFEIVHVLDDVGLARWRAAADPHEAWIEVAFDGNTRARSLRVWVRPTR